jgi:hypothetical protein
MLKNALLKIIHNAISEEELKQSVVYIQPSIATGETITINRKHEQVAKPALLLFIDMEPGVNWSHKCKYILVENEGRQSRTVDGQFPPSSENMKILMKPPGIQDWQLLTNEFFGNE